MVCTSKGKGRFEQTEIDTTSVKYSEAWLGCMDAREAYSPPTAATMRIVRLSVLMVCSANLENDVNRSHNTFRKWMDQRSRVLLPDAHNASFMLEVGRRRSHRRLSISGWYTGRRTHTMWR